MLSDNVDGCERPGVVRYRGDGLAVDVVAEDGGLHGLSLDRRVQQQSYGRQIMTCQVYS